MALPKLLTIKETADVLRVSVSATYNIIARKELTSIKVGGTIRIREKDLLKLLGET